MWIADMDFRTVPVMSAALRERIDRDVLGYTFTLEACYQNIVHYEKEKRHSNSAA